MNKLVEVMLGKLLTKGLAAMGNKIDINMETPQGWKINIKADNVEVKVIND